ncbi:MGDG synthase family glycosyltransferase [Heyndrickxia sp. NPDC080065]|uniref:MGDG synthase family glycosyltransferase n=1 Tax=Heyndrickxia sp. NPDC080065 TaxID=3390568 RepID=UPI003CFE4EE5
MEEMVKGKVLILSGSFGQGHQQVAYAVEEAIQKRSPNTEVVVVDFLAWAHPYFYHVAHFTYMKMLKYSPKLYGFLYKKTYKKSSMSTKLDKILSAGIGKMQNLIQMIQPSIIINTFPFAAAIVSKLKEYQVIDIPSITVITDHTSHSYWIHPFTDQYIVASGKVKQSLVDLGIKRETVACTGIPIRSKFSEPSNRDEIRKKYELDPTLPTILIMGGGEGLIGKEILKSNELETLHEKIQFLIICGKNKKLKKNLEKEFYDSKHIIKIFGYTENIHELMSVSELVITKPGGVTTSEALVTELPMILFKPLPGQEEDNAHYLIQSGAAIAAENSFDLLHKINIILANKNILQKLKSSAKKIQMTNASLHALYAIINAKVQVGLNSGHQTRIDRWKTNRLFKKSLLFNQGH